jgi:hypothetical protein
MARVPQSAMLRYFLRVDPTHGARQVSASLAARKDTHCYSNVGRVDQDADCLVSIPGGTLFPVGRVLSFHSFGQDVFVATTQRHAVQHIPQQLFIRDRFPFEFGCNPSAYSGAVNILKAKRIMMKSPVPNPQSFTKIASVAAGRAADSTVPNLQRAGKPCRTRLGRQFGAASLGCPYRSPLAACTSPAEGLAPSLHRLSVQKLYRLIRVPPVVIRKTVPPPLAPPRFVVP